METWISTWAARSRRRQRRTVIVCVVIALALTTLDHPGLAIYAIDIVAALVLILWLRVRRSGKAIAPSARCFTYRSQ